MARKSNMNSWSLLILRLVFGIIFLYHGYGKLFVKDGFPKFAAMLANLGIPASLYLALLVSVVEFAGGLFLLIGFMTKWASFALIINMLVALFKVHLPRGYGNSEFVILIIAGLLVIYLSGPGKFSLGTAFKKSFLH